MTYRRRIGPHPDRPYFVITRTLQDAPCLYRVTSQNHRTGRFFGEDLATGVKSYISVDDALANHDDEEEARRCFDELTRRLPEIDAAVWRARRAAEDAERARRRTLREIAIGTALTP